MLTLPVIALATAIASSLATLAFLGLVDAHGGERDRG